MNNNFFNFFINMKTLSLALMLLVLAGCTVSAPGNNDNMPPAPVPVEESETGENDDDIMDNDEEENFEEEDQYLLSNQDGVVIVLDDLSERETIQSPLEISGTVRRDWMFEGSFPITLLTLDNDIVKEWYGTGPWLEPLDGDTYETMEGDDMIPFMALIEFDAPMDGDLGKLRFGNSVIAEEDVPEYVEMMILWP